MIRKTDLVELRRLFTFAPGEHPAKSNIVLELISEVEQLREALATANKTNLEMAKELAALK